MPEQQATAELAEAAYLRSDWSASEQYYTRLVTAEPQQAEYWYRLGNIYAFTERPQAAEVVYREALRIDPGLTDAWYNLGLLQLKQAAVSFGQLQLHADGDSETLDQGRTILRGILELIRYD